jgi:putative N-acetylmannosamine-6-phosphate epimerase
MQKNSFIYLKRALNTRFYTSILVSSHSYVNESYVNSEAYASVIGATLTGYLSSIGNSRK